jgi:hypothetical protein
MRWKGREIGVAGSRSGVLARILHLELPSRDIHEPLHVFDSNRQEAPPPIRAISPSPSFHIVPDCRHSPTFQERRASALFMMGK